MCVYRVSYINLMYYDNHHLHVIASYFSIVCHLKFCKSSWSKWITTSLPLPLQPWVSFVGGCETSEYFDSCLMNVGCSENYRFCCWRKSRDVFVMLCSLGCNFFLKKFLSSLLKKADQACWQVITIPIHHLWLLTLITQTPLSLPVIPRDHLLLKSVVLLTKFSSWHYKRSHLVYVWSSENFFHILLNSYINCTFLHVSD